MSAPGHAGLTKVVSRRGRAAAIEFYSRGLPVGEVEGKTRVDRRTLYRMIERALRRHPDGRPWGFRALIPSLRTVAYERRKNSNGKGRGLSASFGQLLDRHRELEGLLRELIQTREVLLLQRGDRFYVKGLNLAHNRFTARYLIVPYPKNTTRVVPVAGVHRYLLSRTPAWRPSRSIALRFHAPPKPWVAIHGNPRNAWVTPLEASGEAFCAAALRKPVICLSWKVGMSSALALTTVAL